MTRLTFARELLAVLAIGGTLSLTFVCCAWALLWMARSLAYVITGHPSALEAMTLTLIYLVLGNVVPSLGGMVAARIHTDPDCG